MISSEHEGLFRNKDSFMRSLLHLSGVAMALSLVGCVAPEKAPVTQGASGTYPVQLRTSSYSTASLFSRLLLPHAHAAVSDLRLCFKRLRFKQTLDDSPEDTEDNIDFNLGERQISSSGQLLGTINLPAGTYYRVEFDLEPSCGGVSARVTNDFGTFTSAENIKVKFEGVFVVDGSAVLELGVENILTEVNAHSGGNLADRLESISGDL